MINFMANRFSRKLTGFCVLNIFILLTGLCAQNLAVSESFPDKDCDALDLNKINSSVDVGSFYSIDVTMKKLEENMAKMAQDLTLLKQHVEFAKISEQKKMSQIQKLEKENIKSYKSCLNSSLDNSWTRSASKIECSENKTYESEITTTLAVVNCEPNKVIVNR